MSGEVLWATDRHHAPEFGKLDRADAGGQGRGRAQGGSWSRAQSRGNRLGVTSARAGLDAGTAAPRTQPPDGRGVVGSGSKAVRIAAASTSETTNIPGAWEQDPNRQAPRLMVVASRSTDNFQKGDLVEGDEALRADGTNP